MKNILSFILIFFCVFIYAQNDNKLSVLEYEITYNLGKALVKKGYVFKKNDTIHFNSTKSVFLENIEDFVGQNSEGLPQINVARGVINENVFTNKDSLFILSAIGNERFLVSEKRPSQKWVATGNTKQISNRLCHEFTMDFRGRDYIAFIDLSVPIDFGPWKFMNLPGLLVSIKDSKNQLSWKLLSLKNYPIDKTNKLANDQIKFLSALPKLYIREYVYLYDRTNGGLFSISRSRLPRDYKRVQVKTNSKRGDRELIYEWEN